MSRSCLILFAKSPEACKVKTRLCPPLSYTQAAELYKAFLQDTAQTCLQLEEVDLVLAYTGAREPLEALLGSGWQFTAQIGEDLGERLIHASRWALEQDYRRIVIIGSDSPSLPLDYLREALDALHTNEVVLGPSVDGGYYLIGFGKIREQHHRYIPSAFQQIEWSTAGVFRQTINRLDMATKLSLLPPWYDVDTIDTLQWMKTHLDAMQLAGTKDMPQRTMKLLEQLSLHGHALW